MDKKMPVDAFGWGFALWLIGYLLGIALFFVLSPSMLGWVIMPIGFAIAMFVSLKKIGAEGGSGNTIGYFLTIAIVWTLMALILDYIFIVKMLGPADGYYKLDVYVYYALTFAIPLAAGYWRLRKKTGG
jgi:hypothetical protein